MLKSQAQKSGDQVPQDSESLASLLKFLIQVVMNQQSGVTGDSEARKEATKQNLKDLLALHTTEGGADPL